MDEDHDGPRFPPGAMDYVYAQIAADLERRIRAGEWAYGDRLPAREALAAEYGAAVMTVRRAQRDLAERGIIRIVVGKGAYVTLAPAGGDSPP
jgi:GntR family transcriptional regulator